MNMQQKSIYTSPELEIIELEPTDVLTDSTVPPVEFPVL